MKLSYPMLAMCVLSLAACNAASDGEPDAVPELVTPAPTGFTSRDPRVGLTGGLTWVFESPLNP